MTRAGYHLYFSQVVGLAFCIVTVIFFYKSINFFFVTFAHKLANDLFCYVATDIFIIIAFSPYFLFFHFPENMQTAIGGWLWGFFFLECFTFEANIIVDYDVVGERGRHIPNQGTIRSFAW